MRYSKLSDVTITIGQTVSAWRNDHVDAVVVNLQGHSGNAVVATTIEVSPFNDGTQVATYKEGTPAASVIVPPASEARDYYGLPGYKYWRLKIAGAQATEMRWYANKQVN